MDPLNNLPSPRTVLLVDDETYLLSAMVRAFRKFPHWRTVTACGGNAALALLNTQLIDVVVSDMRMPIMDGKELLERIGRQYPKVRRIMLTGSIRGDLAMSTYSILAKPCSIESLVALLDKV
jgi:DNA-binding NtrC family response regulator